MNRTERRGYKFLVFAAVVMLFAAFWVILVATGRPLESQGGRSLGNGLLDIFIISFVFTPLALTVTLLLSFWWTQIKNRHTALSGTDTPELLLTTTLGWMPVERRDWGVAMKTELSRVQGLAPRWRFALGCARVALFPPRRGGPLMLALVNQQPVCGVLAVALPPLGLPFIYFTTLIVEAIGGSPFTQSSRWSNPDAVIVVVNIIMKLMFFCLLAGLPLGLAGLLRRERLRWLSVMGMLSSLCIVGYFIFVMHFVAGGPMGD